MSTSTQQFERGASESDAVRPRPWLAARMLAWREIVRFFRQPNRVIGAVGQPLIFWLLFSAGFHRSFQLAGGAAAEASGGVSFQQYYFAGTLFLILMFTAIFATISIIEDRREGFLQSVLVAPLPRWSMVLGKVLGGSLIALLQSLLVLLLALMIQIELTPLKFLWLTCLLSISAIGLTSLGMVIAWRMDSTQGFHAIMSLLLMPMWLLSGAFFPIPALVAGTSWPLWILHWVMKLNPLSYAVAGTQRLLLGDVAAGSMYSPSLPICWLVTIGFAVVMFAAACWIAGTRIRGDLQ